MKYFMRRVSVKESKSEGMTGGNFQTENRREK
jgi:hypothetical protein